MVGFLKNAMNLVVKGKQPKHSIKFVCNRSIEEIHTILVKHAKKYNTTYEDNYDGEYCCVDGRGPTHIGPNGAKILSYQALVEVRKNGDKCDVSISVLDNVTMHADDECDNYKNMIIKG